MTDLLLPIIELLAIVIVVCFAIEWLKKWSCRHKWLPIVYGLMMRYIDDKGRYVPPKTFFPGGCVVRDKKFHCVKCGKEK